jgi:hypothetical protein
MSKISNEAELKASIRELELKTQQQEKALKDNVKSTAKSFKPANLVKIGLENAQEVAMSRDIRAVALNTFIGLAAGYITRRFIVGRRSNIFKRTLAAVVQTAITKIVYKKLPEWQQKSARLIANYNRPKTIARRIDVTRIEDITSE